AETAPANVANVIDIQQFGTVELKVGQVVLCEAVPKSEKLLRLMVDVGEGAPRQLVAGIAKAYRPEQLAGTQVVIVANLKPAKLMGLESRGMVLAATQADGQPVLLRPEAVVAPGTRVK
ncbi:MAG: methionine--tRNA ligase subunit beta, partial [Thermoanaerobaculia bacterium]